MKPDARRHALDMAAQCLRDRLHYASLGGPIDLARGAEIARALGMEFDDFIFALGRECGHNETLTGEPFYTAADKIATRFEERAREIRSDEDSDPRADRGCWKYHQGAGA